MVKDVDRGVLARVDRRLLARLGDDVAFHMVRVPATAAKWSTWKRYCDAAGVSMGRAILALIDRELISVFGETSDDEMPVFAADIEEEIAARQTALADRARRLDADEQRLREWAERLGRWEGELNRHQQQVEVMAKLVARPRQTGEKIGRNERCPCDSGLKYKHCHGLPGRQDR